jgi:mono/diheme cytochrome c family protein
MKLRNLTVLAAMMLSAMSLGAYAEETAGQNEYMVACAVCHGESGLGNGPFADVLNIETPNLTTLAAENDGEFPFTNTLMLIDGRTGVRGHGGPMPIWGDRYSAGLEEELGPWAAETIARGRLLSLVYYLESIQQ